MHRQNRFNSSRRAVRSALSLMTTLTITDTTDATVTVMLSGAGEVGVAKGSAATKNDWFQVNGTGDTTDNGLQTSKGSAPAAGDRFKVESASSIKFLGNYA